MKKSILVFSILSLLSCGREDTTQNFVKENSTNDKLLLDQKLFDLDSGRYKNLVTTSIKDSIKIKLMDITTGITEDSLLISGCYAPTAFPKSNVINIIYSNVPNGSSERLVVIDRKNKDLIIVYHDTYRRGSDGDIYGDSSFSHNDNRLEGKYFDIGLGVGRDDISIITRQITTFKEDSMKRVYDWLTKTDYELLYKDSASGVYCSRLESPSKYTPFFNANEDIAVPVVDGFGEPRLYYGEHWFKIHTDGNVEKLD
jgi:hypothetical protein